MNDMEALRTRHSVREYLDKPIEPEVLCQLQALVEGVAKESGLNIQLLQDNPEAFDLVARFGLIRGCRTLIAFVAHKKDQDEAIGYWGQHIVLEAQKMGLNTCWVALFSRKKCHAVCPSGNEARVVVAVGYGATQGKPRKSKQASDIVTIEPGADKPAWLDAAVEAALLAPTAMNRQDFHLELSPNGELRVDVPGTGLTNIDKGIVRRNIEVAKNAHQ